MKGILAEHFCFTGYNFLKNKKTCSTGAGQQAAMIDAANLRRCFEWKLLIAQNRQVSWLADLHLSGLLTDCPQWHIRISSLLTVTSSLRLLPDSLFYILYFIYQIKANMAICFDPVGNIHLSCSLFNKNQYTILRRNWQSCFYKIPLVYFFV